MSTFSIDIGMPCSVARSAKTHCLGWTILVLICYVGCPLRARFVALVLQLVKILNILKEIKIAFNFCSR